MSKKNKKNKKNKKSKGVSSFSPCCCREVEALAGLEGDSAYLKSDMDTDTDSPSTLESCGQVGLLDKSHYTPQGEHPEDRIFKDKTFINRLSEVQNTAFEKLAEDLNLTQEGSDLLFDYVYNEEHDLDFAEWLERLSQKYENLIDKK